VPRYCLRLATAFASPAATSSAVPDEGLTCRFGELRTAAGARPVAISWVAFAGIGKEVAVPVAPSRSRQVASREVV
jgi:hypothetical protein